MRHRMPTAVVAGVVALLSTVMIACGGQATPRGPEDAGPTAVPRGKLEVGAAGFTLVDPSKFAEPAENATGGIPKADLEATPKHGARSG